jgi:hypothetical protein
MDKVYTYKQLEEKKSNGENLNWNKISKEQLRHLSQVEYIPALFIGELYDITKSKVAYKRKKFGINSMGKITNEFIDNVPETTNEALKTVLLNNFDINKFSRAIAHYVFRNGPVEDMHSDGKFSDADMMVLNKYMVNRVAGILQLINDEQWLKLVGLINIYGIYGADWDKAKPDIAELETAIKLMR